MKKMMILVSAIMMAITANAQRVETASFEEVRVNVPARVRIVAGENYSINIATKNEEVAKAVNCSVKDGVLCINTRDIEALDNDNSVRITIVTPRELKVTTNRAMEAQVLRNTFVENKDLARK